jgi:ATP adenylyltransferase
LKAYDDLSADEIVRQQALCEEKIAAYIDKRGKRIWEHRKKSSGYISGTLRYEVMKRAKFRCELCGVMDKEKALEVDHIIPRNSGGSDDESNLQALCYSCNAMKRDRDDTDFRGIADSYNHREEGCIFCELERDQIAAENELMIAIRDRYPVTELHTLIIPKRHCETYFDLYQPELNAMNHLIQSQRDATIDQDSSITGFNIGANAGAASGQTVDHCHIHLIPRRAGDVGDPTGGVRGVIRDKQRF